jgi:tRNA A-37 threonylcarbamoyl transferase component Bud32/type II secretory pathway pseudopilin PulG
MSETSKCPKCGAPMPPDAVEGLCPRCLIALNLATQTEIPGEPGTARVPPAPPLPVADVAKLFPQLEILECLGRGGMGAVYKARQPRLDRLVALKVLSPEKQGNQKFAERFEREARALAKLHHPNIVAVYDFGEVGGNFYLLMEFIDGLTLRQLFQARKLSPSEALAIVPKICEALQYAHEQGIVHRDIKPENILMDKEGRIKIADFGIAKILGESANASLTAEQIIGTPHYMSPEQIERPQSVDHRADIYSLGVVFYEMLTGELPLGKFQPPSKKVQVDVRLDEIVLRALEKEPERRYQQASEVKTQVETIAATAESNQSRREEAQIESPGQTLFSRTAIAGAIWALFFGIMFLLMFMPWTGQATTYDGPLWWQRFCVFLFAQGWPMYNPNSPAWGMFTILPLGLTAPFGATILGWIAISQIRRSKVKLYGLKLAAFDGLLFPVLLFDGFIFELLYLGLEGVSKLFLSDHPIVRGGIPDSYQIGPLFGLWISLGILFSMLADFLIIRRVWLAIKITSPAGAGLRLTVPSPPVQKPDHFWRWFAVIVLALISIPFLISIMGLLAAIAIPNFVKARQHAQALRQQALAGEAGQMTSKSFYLGQAWFPDGDSIEITSVERASNEMIVGGHYHLVSRDTASLELHITSSTNSGLPQSSGQAVDIVKGDGDFQLKDTHVIPGLPHVSMYADGHSFAAIYFGTEDEADKESQATWITNGIWASMETWSPTLAPGEKPDLGKILQEAKDLMNQGHYEDALQRHLWYHHHALEYDQGQTGVRLSFALVDWVELGRRYPKAKQALMEIRDGDTQKILRGEGYFSLFMDVHGINQYLGDDDATYELFKTIEKSDPKLAAQGYLVVEDLLVNKGEYETCRKYLGDPQGRFQTICNEYQMDLQNQARFAKIDETSRQRLAMMKKLRGGTNAPAYSPLDISVVLKKSAEGRFVVQVRQLIEILVGTGDKVEADDIQKQALVVLNDPRLASAVSDAKVKVSEHDNVEESSEAIDQQAPVVVETFPVSGAREVEPGDTEMRVRFSKGMADGSWSWSTAWENSTPESLGLPHYLDDHRTCVLKVHLEPGKTYAWWLNSDQFKNFTDADGRPAVPYLFSFQTKSNQNQN